MNLDPRFSPDTALFSVVRDVGGALGFSYVGYTCFASLDEVVVALVRRSPAQYVASVDPTRLSSSLILYSERDGKVTAFTPNPFRLGEFSARAFGELEIGPVSTVYKSVLGGWQYVASVVEPFSQPTMEGILFRQPDAQQFNAGSVSVVSPAGEWSTYQHLDGNVLRVR